MSVAVDLHLPHLGPCLRIDGAPEVVDALIKAMPGWPITVKPAKGPLPSNYIYQDAQGLWQGSLRETHEFHLPSPASAACSLVGELISQRMLNQPELLGLHCGSVEINGRLVLFPESSKAGKSTLTVAFAAAGYRVFGDDVLGLNAQGEGVAMGVAPTTPTLARQFFSGVCELRKKPCRPEDERYRFVLPDEGGLAGFNDTCPVGAIVLLERDSQLSEPELVTLPPAEGLLQLLCQNFAHDTADAALLTRLLPLMQTVPCLLLRYAEPLVGARYLAKVIKEPQLQTTHQASLLNIPPHDTQLSNLSRAQASLEKCWTADNGVTTYPLGDELFLIHTASGAIHRLNSSGKVTWQLLQQQALSGHELSDLIASHFQVPLRQVNADITSLLTALAAEKLIAAQP